MGWGARLVHRTKTRGEDNALLVLKFASGGIAHCELSWTTKGGLDLRNEVHGSEGSIFTDVTRSTPIACVHQPFRRIRRGEGRSRHRLDAPAARRSLYVRISGGDAPLRRVRPRRTTAERNVRGRLDRESRSRCRLPIDEDEKVGEGEVLTVVVFGFGFGFVFGLYSCSTLRFSSPTRARARTRKRKRTRKRRSVSPHVPHPNAVVVASGC